MTGPAVSIPDRCPAGHAMVGMNLITTQGRGRACRACLRVEQREWKAPRPPAPRP